MRLNLFTAVALALVGGLLPGVKPPVALKAEPVPGPAPAGPAAAEQPAQQS